MTESTRSIRTILVLSFASLLLLAAAGTVEASPQRQIGPDWTESIRLYAQGWLTAIGFGGSAASSVDTPDGKSTEALLIHRSRLADPSSAEPTSFDPLRRSRPTSPAALGDSECSSHAGADPNGAC